MIGYVLLVLSFYYCKSHWRQAVLYS